MHRYPPETLHDPETSRAESYIGIAVMLAAFAVSTSVCSGIVTLALLP
jgi:hypothetical protein